SSTGPSPRRWRVRAFALAALVPAAVIAAPLAPSIDGTGLASTAASTTAGSDDIGARLAAPQAIVDLVDAGDFKGAEAAIAAALADASLSADQRTALEFQRERMRRILLDFRLDEAGAKERLRRDIPDLSDAEFARWDAAGLIEARVIDGE